MGHKHHTVEIGNLRNKIRDANSRIDAMSAISLRQKDEEVTELLEQVEIHKATISELQKTQDVMKDLLTSLQNRITALEDARGLEGGDASTGVERGLNAMRGEMIELEQRVFGEYTRKEDLTGMESAMEKVINQFIDSVNKQLQDTQQRRGSIGDRLAALESRKLDERLGRLEAVSFELMTAAFAQAKLENAEYEEASIRRRQEMERFLAPGRKVQPAIPPTAISATELPQPAVLPTNSPTNPTIPRAQGDEPSKIPETLEENPKSSRVIAQLPRRTEPDTLVEPPTGRFAGWPGFSQAPTAVQDPLIQRNHEMQGALRDALDIITATGDDRYSMQFKGAQAGEPTKAPAVGPETSSAVGQSEDKVEESTADTDIIGPSVSSGDTPSQAIVLDLDQDQPGLLETNIVEGGET